MRGLPTESRCVCACRYYGDLAEMKNDALAAHYKAYGLRENRTAQRLRVVATYEAAAGRDLTVLYGGLCNQIYSHVGMLAVLLKMGAEVVRSVGCSGRLVHDRPPCASHTWPHLMESCSKPLRDHP